MARELLYRKLAEKWIRAISTGVHPVGTLLPSEQELMKIEGVSRHTVRAALKILEQYGLIKRTPHVGTTVISRGALLSFNRQLSTLSDLDRLAERNPRKLLDIREAVLERPLSDELGRPAGDVCIRFSMIRTGSADGAPPIAWTTEYVRRDWIELIRAAKDFPHLLMIELIERLFRKHCMEVRQVIEARALPEEGARHLNAATGSPALRIVRNYVDESGEILLSTVSYHPGDRYAFNLNARVPEHKRNERLDETLFDRLRNGS